jgi:hypothetical protein
MHAIPVIVLALILKKRSEYMQKGGFSKWAKLMLVVSVGLSVILQYRVFPPSEKLVSQPRLFLYSHIAQFFPLESSLLPSVAEIMPRGFKNVDNAKKNTIYKIGSTALSDNKIQVEGPSASLDFVLYQTGCCENPPSLGVLTTVPVMAAIESDGKIIKEIKAMTGLNQLIQFDKSIFEKSFFDLLSNSEIRWKKMALKVSPCLESKTEATGCLDIVFCQLPLFNKYGVNICPENFPESGIKRYFSWSDDENWGVWTDGRYALLTMNLGEFKEPLLFFFDVNAYTPPESPRRMVNVFVNNTKKATWNFIDGATYPETQFLVIPEDSMNSPYLNIAFKIEDPISPLELGRSSDPRKLGLGLRSLKIIKIEGTHGGINVIQER